VVLPPLPSLIIALGVLLLSIVTVNWWRKPSLFGKNVAWALLALAVPLLLLGFGLHFKEPVRTAGPGPSRSASPEERASPDAADRETAKAPLPAGFEFSFEPRSARWGQEVQIRVTPPREDVTVYYNGRPLPARALGKGTFVVTIPSMSKDGYFTLDSGGRQVKARDRLAVSAY